MSERDGKLAGEYQRLMRWYPRAWRLANEDAMLGALLDQAEHEGLEHPAPAQRLAITRAGLGERLRERPTGGRMRLIPLALAAALSFFYAVFVIWSPRTNYPGSIGPFSNASIITCVLLIAAFVAALSVTGRLANVLAVAAAIAELVIGIVAAFHPVNGPSPWEGPSPTGATLFTGLALLGGLDLRRGWMLIVGGLLVAAAVAAWLVVEFVSAVFGYFNPVSTGLVVGIAVAVLASIVVTIVGRRADARAVASVAE